MLKEEVKKFSRLSGEDGQHTSICRICAYLDGYNRGLSEDRWIPCSERLPEEDGTLRGYLASIGDWVGILCFVEEKFVEWTSSYELKEPEFPVKAWMSLPEPYQPKEDK